MYTYQFEFLFFPISRQFCYIFLWYFIGNHGEQMVCGNADFQTTAPYLSQLLDRYEP